MELKTNKRELTIPTKSIDVETRTIDVAFCSETPVEREINGEIYNEVLICTPQSVDLRRLNNNGAVLFNHNRDDLIGAVVSARIDSDRVGRATLRISNTATDKWEMIQEGVLVHISIGYNINNYRIDGNTIYVTDFEIYEVSLVTVPADVMAGIGRSMDNVDISESLNNNSETKSEDQPVMEDENKVDSVEEPSLIEEIKDEVKEIEDAVETVVEEIETVVEEIETAVETVVEEIKGEPRSLTDDELFDELQARPELINKINNIDEENRKRELIAIGSVLNINVDEAIAKGISVAEFKRSLNEKNTPNHDKEIKLMKKSILSEMIRSIKTGDKSGLEGFERGLNGYVRAVTPATNTTTAAGAVNEDLQDQYIPELLKLSVLGELNPTVYSGLAGRGVLSIPVASGVAPVFKFYAEDEVVTDSIASFGKITLSPKTFAGAIPLGRTAILTAPHIESFVQTELQRYAAQGLEQSVFDKIADAAPVLTTAGVGVITLADVQKAVAQLASANVDIRRCRAVMNSKTLSGLRQTAVLDNTAAKAMVEGYRADSMWLADEVQVSVSEFIEDGVVLIGKFDEVLIANWENSEVDFDDTTYRSSNVVVYRVWDYTDVALAHDEAFVQLTIKTA